jgi:hypothetical protein
MPNKQPTTLLIAILLVVFGFLTSSRFASATEEKVSIAFVRSPVARTAQSPLAASSPTRMGTYTEQLSMAPLWVRSAAVTRAAARSSS